MSLTIGIDTGGTYTDAVIYDTESEKILAFAKSLTTKKDLSIGIGNSLDKLPSDIIHKARIISLSTTLATNACVEEKGGKAKLLLFGMSLEKAMQYGRDFGTYTEDDIICVETQTAFSGKIGIMPDWESLRNTIKSRCSDCEAMAVVEMYARQTGACLEKKAREIINEILGIPTVCGYELFDDLNYLKRGASSLLNAKLIPLVGKFIEAVQNAAKKRNLDIPVVIVRSDGTIMSLEYTRLHPIETLLCGPVASAIGAKTLSGKNDAIIVDIGGTTSDIAILEDGEPLKEDGGVNIGNWQTFVSGLYIDTFGLGGDSGIRYKDGKMILETRRLIPICILADKYPKIVSELKGISVMHQNSKYIHEFLVLQNEPKYAIDYTKQEIRLIDALKKGPLSLSAAAEAAGSNLYSLNTQRLEDENIIMRSGLTPTDIMHIKGDYTNYCAEAAVYAADFVARNLKITREELCDKIYDAVCQKLYLNLVRIFFGRKYCSLNREQFCGSIEKLFSDEWEHHFANKEEMIKLSVKVPVPLIGIGGPSHIFLDKVAKALGTTAVIPQYSVVANAVGAAVCNAGFEIRVLVRPIYEKHIVISGFNVFAKGIVKKFYPAEYDKAVEYAENIAEQLAAEEAKVRGMSDKTDMKRNKEVIYFPESDILDEVKITVRVKGSI